MKKVILMACLALGLVSSRLQAQDSTRTLLKVPHISTVGIYAAPEFQFGQLHNDFTTFGGGSLMLVLNKRFAIGATGMRSLDRNYSPTGVSPLVLHSGFGGLKLEYTVNPNAPIHISFPLVIGGGSARADSAFYSRRRPVPGIDTVGRFNRPNNGVNYFLIQPGVQVEANIFSFMKLYIGASYRLPLQSNTFGTGTLPANTLQGFSASIGIKAGIFDIPTSRR
jgi:hypothetical protein